MNRLERISEQMKHVLPNIFTNDRVTVLAYCARCLDYGKEVPLESRLKVIGRQERQQENEYSFKVEQFRIRYEHTIACEQGHKVYEGSYWSRWENSFDDWFLFPTG